jgi:arsenate reductase
MRPTIWHNPRCTTSRHALDLLVERGHEPLVIAYLTTPPSTAEIDQALKRMRAAPDAIVRLKGAPEDAAAAWAAAGSDARRLAALAAHPILIERPIVIAGRKAALVRPKAQAEAILVALGL